MHSRWRGWRASPAVALTGIAGAANADVVEADSGRVGVVVADAQAVGVVAPAAALDDDLLGLAAQQCSDETDCNDW